MCNGKVRFIACLLLISTLAAGCSGPSGRQGTADSYDALIVPNKRIGPAALGLNEQQVFERLGRPDATVGEGDGAYLFRRQGIQIAFGNKGAYMVAVTKPGFASRDGIEVGAMLELVRKRWGNPTDSRETDRCIGRECNGSQLETIDYCFANGMQASVDALKGRVTRLQVQSGGCALP